MDIKTQLATSIMSGQTLIISYKDETRTVEPYTLGMMSNDTEQLVGWQTSGDRPGWRLYKLSGVEIVELTETYTGPTREGYNPRDRRMKEIYSTRQPVDATEA